LGLFLQLSTCQGGPSQAPFVFSKQICGLRYYLRNILNLQMHSIYPEIILFEMLCNKERDVSMGNYTVPPDTKEKEKIVGGLLYLSQAFWLFLGFIIGGTAFILLYGVIGGAFSIVIGIILAGGIGVPFAFYKKEELTLFQYLRLKHKFKRRIQKLPNMRKGESA
jgi:hypothetical protein